MIQLSQQFILEKNHSCYIIILVLVFFKEHYQTQLSCNSLAENKWALSPSVYIWYHSVLHATIYSEMLFLPSTCIYFQHIGYKNAMNKKKLWKFFCWITKKWNSREFYGIQSMNIVNNNILNTCNFVLITMYLHFRMYDCHKNKFLKFPDFFIISLTK